MQIEIKRKFDLGAWDFDEADILASKLDEIIKDIVAQIMDRKGKVVVFISEDHKLTWEVLTCKK